MRFFLALPGLHGDVGAREGGDVVLIGIGRRGVMARAFRQLHAHGLRSAAQHGGFLRSDDVRGSRLRQVGQKNMMPKSGPVHPWRYIADI